MRSSGGELGGVDTGAAEDSALERVLAERFESSATISPSGPLRRPDYGPELAF